MAILYGNVCAHQLQLLCLNVTLVMEYEDLVLQYLSSSKRKLLRKVLKDECDISHEIMKCREQAAQLLMSPLGQDSHNKSHYTRFNTKTKKYLDIIIKVMSYQTLNKQTAQLLINVYELDWTPLVQWLNYILQCPVHTHNLEITQ